MFGLSWGQIAIIVLVGVFVLGPERIPTAVRWVTDGLRKLRTMAAGAQAQLNREIGPELDELRRQIADLQSLKEIQELRDLRDLHPKRLIGNTILGEEFSSGGISGFLGLNGAGNPGRPAANREAPVKPVSAVPSSSPAFGSVPSASSAAPGAPVGSSVAGAGASPPPADSADAAVRSASAGRPTRPATQVGSLTSRLAAPKVVGAPRRVPAPPPATTPATGFDVDAT